MCSAEQIAQVAVKNNRNGANNPYAQRQKAVTLEEVMAGPPISGIADAPSMLPRRRRRSRGDRRFRRRDRYSSASIATAQFKVIASVTKTEHVYRGAKNFDAELTRETVEQAYREAGIQPSDLDLIELHDAFTIEELLYAEAMGLCGRAGAGAIAAGEFDVGGRCAISASGGLLAMGHPIGPTGAGQIAEITRQLRGEAGVRQQPNAKTGLAHMVGVGAVCVVHILQKGRVNDALESPPG